MHLNHTWIKDEIITEIGKYFKLNDNEIMIYKNLLDLAKAIVKALKYKEYNWKQQTVKISDIIIYIKKLDKEQHIEWYRNNKLEQKVTWNREQTYPRVDQKQN